MDSREPVRVAVNVMRARITVLGFNIAIIAFQISHLHWTPGGVRLPNVSEAVHPEADIALFLGFGFSVIALICYLGSSAYDSVGVCNHWSLLAGDLVMYLALAHTVSGFFGPFVGALKLVSLASPEQQSEMWIATTATAVVGGVAWFAAAYGGPLVALLRSPFGRPVTMALGIAYAAAFLAAAGVSSATAHLQAARAGDPAGAKLGLLTELVQPIRW